MTQVSSNNSLVLIAVFLSFAAPLQAAEVISFTLIDADTNSAIASHDPLLDGTDLDLSVLASKNLSVRANVDSTPGSVSFELSGASSQNQTESTAPYALFGDNNGNYNAWTPALGQYQLTARSHSAAAGGGTAGTDLSISFTVSEPVDPLPDDGDGSAVVTGEFKRWHKVTVTQDAVAASETSSPNPFLDYRFNVVFIGPSAQQYLVPGYFAGDGAGGSIGTLWQAHFAADEVGEWSYQISFREGTELAVELEVEAGNAVVPFDGVGGEFIITESDQSGADFRSPARGMISNHGSHYLQHASGKVWLKGGPNIPENLFGYVGFDNTPDAGHSFTAHLADWNSGDPDWNAGAGQALIGALNFIAGRGANSIYFLPMNIGGDGKDTFPTISDSDKTRYDLSKLGQWEIAMSHAETLGIFLHFVLAETESANENYHDNGNLGPERKLYYRMLLALFGHHNGLQLNIGEENDYGSVKHRQFAAYIKAMDAYDHPVTTHTHGNQYDNFYDPLLGDANFDITSFQGNDSRTDMFDLVQKWRSESDVALVPWVVSFDEPQKIENDVNDDQQGYPHGRRDKMWPVYMAGGGGFEWYVQQDGGGHSLDQQIDDFNILDEAMRWTGHALAFLDLLPLEEMTSNRSQASAADGSNSYVLAASDEVYAVYNDRNGGPIDLDLSDAGLASEFKISWFNPRTGALQNGDIARVTGGSTVNIGSAPEQLDQDWAVLLIREDNVIFVGGFEAQPDS